MTLRRRLITRRAAIVVGAGLAAAPYALRKPAKARSPNGSSHYDTWLAVAMGDSNNGSGQFFNASYDTSTPTVLQIKHTTRWPVVVAREPLDQTSMGANDVGPHTKIAQFLMNNGRVPANIQRIVIVPNGWAGTGLSLVAGNTGFWNVNGSRRALDNSFGLYATIDAAKAAYPNSKIAYFNWIEGANDGGMTQADYTSAMQALFAEIRARYPDALDAPVLVSGVPPDRISPAMGSQVNLGGVVLAQKAIARNLAFSVYIDPATAPILHSYLDNGYVHYNSASHRGGIPNINLSPSTSSSSGSYDPSTGIVTLTLSKDLFQAPGRIVRISGSRGTGSFASCNGTFTAGTGSGGTTLTYAIAAGLTLTIKGCSVVCVNGYAWYHGTTYNAANSYVPRTSVVASDNFIYTCLTNGNIGKDPTGNAYSSDWAQQWDTSAAVADINCLAYRQYQGLLSMGF